jgi:protein-tyrosine phosphatase
MIDLHCHFLPGIDDGAKTVEEALQLAAAAVADGIETIVATPHVHLGRYSNTRSTIVPEVQAFREQLARHAIALDVRAGGEVRFSEDIIDLVQRDEIPFLGISGGYRILLLEFPHSHVPVGADQLVSWLIARRIRPLIAHPERNKDVMYNLDKIRPFVQMGCLLQVTAGSLIGRFGEPACTRAKQMLEQGMISVLATDAHNMTHRPPELAAGRGAAERIVGEQAAWDLVHRKPAELLGLEAH